MKLFQIYLLISCTAFSWSCDSKLKKSDVIANSLKPFILDINPENAQIINTSSLFDEINFIKLQTNEKSLIDEISTISLIGNRFYIEAGKALLVFDQSGNFIYEINKKGEGPGEYKNFRDVLIDSANQTIEILTNHKIISYDMDGNFKNEWKNDIIAISLFKHNVENYFLYRGNNIYDNKSDKLLYVNKPTNAIENKFMPISEKQSRYLFIKDVSNFSFFNDTISFFHSFNDTVFYIRPEGVYPRIILDFGKYRVPDELLEKEYNNILEFLTSLRKGENFAFLVNPYFENQHFIFFSYEFKNVEKRHHVYFAKKTGTMHILSKYTDDLSFNNASFPTSFENAPQGINGNKLIFSIEPSVFNAIVDSLKKNLPAKDWENYKQVNKEVVDIYQKNKLEDNPIICIRKLKNF